MRSYPSTTTAYRAAGKAYGEVHFISFLVKGIADPEALTWCHFCTADDVMSANVTDPTDGSDVTWNFLGGGHILTMGELTRSEGPVVRSLNLVLSGVSDSVRDMVFGYDTREALFQWYVGEVDQDTGLLIDDPSREFIGEVNIVDPSVAALPSDGEEARDATFQVSVNSLGAALLDRNYDMRSLEVSEERDDDQFFEHGDNAHHWRRWWGKEKKSERDRKGGKGGKGK